MDEQSGETAKRELSMHYERVPGFRRLKPEVADAVVAGTARRYGQISVEKAFYLEGKSP
jgi:hypothetical protein